MAMYRLNSMLRRALTSSVRNYYTGTPTTTKLFIDGEFVESKTDKWIDLHNPATNEVITRVPEATQEEMQRAVDSCKKTFESWSETTILTRQQCMFKFQQLIKDNLKEIAKLITLEQGKTLIDAEGDVLRGLQVVEHCCSITSLQLGETMSGIAKDMDTYTVRLPLGVTAGITPFNFPAMIPLWLNALDKAKVDLVSAYTVNSLFWMYLNVCGINPKEHGIKQELDRIRSYMNRVKDIQEAEKAKEAKLTVNVRGAKRVVKSALWEAAKKKNEKQDMAQGTTENVTADGEKGASIDRPSPIEKRKFEVNDETVKKKKKKRRK